jgi:hypothetical protein
MNIANTEMEQFIENHLDDEIFELKVLKEMFKLVKKISPVKYHNDYYEFSVIKTSAMNVFMKSCIVLSHETLYLRYKNTCLRIHIDDDDEDITIERLTPSGTTTGLWGYFDQEFDSHDVLLDATFRTYYG